MRGTFGTVITPSPPIDVKDVIVKLKNIAANQQNSEALTTLKSMESNQKNVIANSTQPQRCIEMLSTENGLHAKDVTIKSPQPQKCVEETVPTQKSTVVEGASKPSTTAVRVPSQKSSTLFKPRKQGRSANISNATDCSPIALAARKLKFCCQLAHGSPTAIISNFSSINELFQSIAGCFNISPDDIIFCTINTFRVAVFWELGFCCQLAHGSPTAIISNFSSIDELFQSIAGCFNISPDDIIFCTINTFRPDMDKLFSGSLEYSDMLFAHVKGQAVEVELTKTEP
ncbi:unnamed protein product [Haemonchus placei]|uniref:AMP-binding domain-containing protein n=1 Tax=Haemonchus placei TaxID=6290 RepID=A0A0N4X8I7_HAEPC|nr:unnamed protein product [Haemonchus placei]